MRFAFGWSGKRPTEYRRSLKNSRFGKGDMYNVSPSPLGFSIAVRFLALNASRRSSQSFQ